MLKNNCCHVVLLMHKIIILLLPGIVLGYDILCPDHSHRQLRSRGLCIMKNKTKSVYTCLEDINMHRFVESCSEEEDVVRPGYRYVIKGQTTSSECHTRRYQPVKFYKTSGAICTYLKSKCTEVGQAEARNGSGLADTRCICDYTKGYAFLTRTADDCYCVPSEEDCTCYKKLCPENHLLSADYECIHINATSMTKCATIGKSGKDINTLTTTSMKTESTAFCKSETRAHFLATLCILVVFVILVPVLSTAREKLKICSTLNIEDKQKRCDVKQHSSQHLKRRQDKESEQMINLHSSGTEKRHYIRCLINGRNEVGKTSVSFKGSTIDVETKDQIDVVQRCKIRLGDRQWIIYKEQMKTNVDNWKKDDQMFVNTRAASHILHCIRTNSCVTVTASSGVGISFTVRHVALQMTADGYDILPIKHPEDIVNFNNPNKKILYVIDDLCGSYTLDQTYFDKWKTTHEYIKELLKNETTKIIASCRLQVYQDEQFKLLTLFTSCVCNLLSQDISLSKRERRLIAEQYLESDATKISEYIYLFNFFPLLCRLYQENKTFNILDFFKNPFSVYEVEIKKLLAEKKYEKLCALALCVLFNNHFEEEWLSEYVNKDIQQKIENTCEACRLNRGTSRMLLRHELESLMHIFLKKEQGCYSTIHDKLFDFLSFYFGKEMTLCFIKNGDARLISERFLFERKDNSDQFATIVPETYQQTYIQRMFDDWNSGEVGIVFTNINMKSSKFREQFLKHLKAKSVQLQIQLANKCDNLGQIGDGPSKLYITYKSDYRYKMITPLLQSCSLGYFDIVEWCCSYNADVNLCCNNEESPLYIACEGGYTNIVSMLIANKANINKCTNDNISPLYVACKGGFTDIATKLVDNKAEINNSKLNEISPLYIACKGGYADIVSNLVDHKADINNCTKSGESPLYIACKRGYAGIVTKLVENHADINKATKLGESPLYIACEGEYTDIVAVLVDNKADINICTYDGITPLHIACKRGYTDIVTKLLDNKADVNKCGRFGESPLYIACKGGYSDIVTKLLDKKAEINKCTYEGISPLYVACEAGYTDIVTKLVDLKADINICADDGISPLFIACKGGYTDIVIKLADNKAVINKCSEFGESPLYITCKLGFTDIVTQLVYHKADINNSTNLGETPLYAACNGGYTEIVKKLLDNKADFNMCTDHGISPLYIACKEGYADVVTILLNNNAKINKSTKFGESPLYIACKRGYTDIVIDLLNHKANINKSTKLGESPLYIACKEGHSDIATMLEYHKANINKSKNLGESPLYVAC